MNILYVEDNPGFERRLKSAFQNNFDNVDLKIINDVDEAIEELHSRPKHYSIVVVDLLFKKIDDENDQSPRGLEVIPVATKSNPRAIVVAISQDSDLGDAALREGADHFVSKGKLTTEPGKWAELGEKIKEIVDQRKTVFLGHGRSEEWRKISDYLQRKLSLDYEEFNRSSTAGIVTVDRLSEMLDKSSFALLIMTAEDQQADGTIHPRDNVVHEAGLFQGKLGFNRAIVLLENGCQEFSNIHGLGYIPFPAGKIEACFHEVQAVLEREGLI